jgi:chaperone required for assembly of F1-ATPase
VKRFWKVAEVVEDGGFGIALDGRPVMKTPARAGLEVPTRRLAEAIAGEWSAAGETVDPRAMPLTGLANAAIDRVAPDCEDFAAGLAQYGEADLLCYRADGPPALAERQESAWGPLLAWARRRYDVDFRVTASIIHQPQPRATAERLAHAVTALDSFRLAGLSPLVTIGGSLVAGLAVLEEAVTAGEAWDAVSLDEQWQLEKWGADAEATAALEARRREFMAAAMFLELLD